MEEVVVTVRMLLPVPPAVRVTMGVPTEKVGGVNTRGEMDADKATAPANEFTLAREIVDRPEVPRGRVSPIGLGVAVKLAGVPKNPSRLLITKLEELPLLITALKKWITPSTGLDPPV